jgi:hypothetical protein
MSTLSDSSMVALNCFNPNTVTIIPRSQINVEVVNSITSLNALKNMMNQKDRLRPAVLDRGYLFVNTSQNETPLVLN